MCMFACFIWNNVPVNCIIQNHYFEIGYEMFVNTRMCLVCFSSKAELVKGAMSPVAHALASENKLEKDGPSFSSAVGDFGRLFLAVEISAIVR